MLKRLLWHIAKENSRIKQSKMVKMTSFHKNQALIIIGAFGKWLKIVINKLYFLEKMALSRAEEAYNKVCRESFV